ncbi:AAA family ATPase [Patescibacteria group bacterium]|nr:AAA family ATPase [Patescibacteria group bacterium]
MDKNILQQNLQLLIGQDRAKLLLTNQSIIGSHPVYLLVGPPQIGKGFLARLMAASWHSTTYDESHHHPDTMIFDDILNKNSVTGEDHQWKKSTDDFIHFMNLSPARSNVKVGILEDIDRFSLSALNSLLKTIEEPPVHTVFILTAQEINNVLPTIISRAQLIRLSYLSDENITNYLQQIKSDHINEITVLANGAIGLAKKLANNPDVFQSVLNHTTALQEILQKNIITLTKSAQIKDRDEAIKVLRIWINLVHRAMLCKMGQPVASLINDVVQEYSAETLMDLVSSLQDACAGITDNANVRITFEAALLPMVS